MEYGNETVSGTFRSGQGTQTEEEDTANNLCTHHIQATTRVHPLPDQWLADWSVVSELSHTASRSPVHQPAEQYCLVCISAPTCRNAVRGFPSAFLCLSHFLTTRGTFQQWWSCSVGVLDIPCLYVHASEHVCGFLEGVISIAIPSTVLSTSSDWASCAFPYVGRELR